MTKKTQPPTTTTEAPPTTTPNLAIWDHVARPPASALKTIRGGRLKGMTDVNPQWRYRAMTDVFGPCGIGWRYDIVRIWTEPGVDGQIMLFAHISLNARDLETGDWSAPIPGVGGSVLVSKEASGLHGNDEAVKMAVTDALSVAMKMLGVAADIYAGRWDGTKYADDNPASVAPPEVDDAEYQAWVGHLRIAAPVSTSKELIATVTKASDVLKAKLRADHQTWLAIKALCLPEPKEEAAQLEGSDA